jgi:chromosome segregation ATPase
MTRERTIDPSRVNICPECAHECLPTLLGIAEHTAKHLDAASTWRTPRARRPSDLERFQAWRDYARELEQHASDLRGQVADLKDELRDERRRFLEDIATRDDRIEELEGEVSDQVHDLQGRLL